MESSQLTPSYLSILPDYISTSSFNSPKCYYPQNKLRILIIDDCPSFLSACKFIIEKDFLDYFTSRPYLFVTIFKCGDSKISPNVCVELQKGFKSKRPLIISLEVENMSKVFYKNYGINENFIEVIYEYSEECQKVTDIKSLIKNLENGYYGSHSGLFEDITINKSKNDQQIDENSAEYLMNIFGERMDLLGIRFLHLFDPTLKPDISIILKILDLDFNDTKLDGFCAVIDLGFEVTQNLKIRSSKGIVADPISFSHDHRPDNKNSISFNDMNSPINSKSNSIVELRSTSNKDLKTIQETENPNLLCSSELTFANLSKLNPTLNMISAPADSASSFGSLGPGPSKKLRSSPTKILRSGFRCLKSSSEACHESKTIKEVQEDGMQRSTQIDVSDQTNNSKIQNLNTSKLISKDKINSISNLRPRSALSDCSTAKTIHKLAFSSTGHLKTNSMDNRKCNSMDNFADECYFDDNLGNNFKRRMDYPVSISANELSSPSSFIRKSNLSIELNENIEHFNSGTSNSYATSNLGLNLSKERALTSSFSTSDQTIPKNCFSNKDESFGDPFRQKDHGIKINITKPDRGFNEDIPDNQSNIINDYVNLEDNLTVNNEETDQNDHQTSKNTLTLHPTDISNDILNYNLDLKEDKEQNLNQKSQLSPNDAKGQSNLEEINLLYDITLDPSEHSVIDSTDHLAVPNPLIVVSYDNLDDFNLNPLIDVEPDPVIMKNLGCNLNFFLDLKFRNQENLLMLAIRCCNIQVSQILINCGINVNVTNQNHEIAADIASQKGQFDILLLLLHANSRFPHKFKIQSEAPEELRNFVKIMDILHEMICNVVEVHEDNSDEIGESFMKIEEQMQKNFTKIQNLVQKLPHLDYWFNTSNQSAVTTAILNKKFSTYNFLISNGLFMGIYEDLDSIKDSLNEDEQELITEVNAYLAQPLPKDYILILKLNSFIWHSHKNEDSHLELIAEALQILDENEYTQPLLEIVAAAKDFRIIFDFNRSSIEAIDFTVRSSVSAVFYAQRSHIYVGAKDMLDSDRKYHAIGTFAHELCHFAMQLTYNNDCRPYREGSRKESIFEKINYACVKLRCHERLVCMVYNYLESFHHAELIVRIPHMIIHYAKDNPKVNNLKEIFTQLDKFYKNEVLEDVKRKIPNVTENFYTNLKLEHAFWEKKAKREKFIRFFLISLVFLGLMSVSGLLWILISYDPCINSNRNCTWDDLLPKTQQNILKTDVIFQGNIVKLEDLIGLNEAAKQALNDKQIRNPKEIVINNQNLNINFDYFERKFTNFNESYWFVEGKCKFVYIPSKIASFDDLRKNNEEKLFILSDEPVTGKSSILKYIANNLRVKNVSKWISFIDFKKVSDEILDKYKKNRNLDFINFLIDSHDEKLEDFEVEIFRNKLDNGDVILLIDHIEIIFMVDRNFGEEVIENFGRLFYRKSSNWDVSVASLDLKTHSYILKPTQDPQNTVISNNIEIWLGMRQSLENITREILKNQITSHVKLVPLYCEYRDNFINQKLDSKNLKTEDKLQISSKITEFFNKTEIWRSQKSFKFDNIYLLDIILTDAVKNVNNSINLFNGVEKMFKEVLGFKFGDQIEAQKKESGYVGRGRILMKIAMKILQMYYPEMKAVNMEILLNAMNHQPYFSHPYDQLNQSDPFISNEISAGIIQMKKEKLNFFHQIYFEYFVASYLKTEFWDTIDTFSYKTLKFENQLKLLFKIIEDPKNKFPLIQKLIFDFVDKNYKMKAFNENFRTEFKIMFEEFKNKTKIKTFRQDVCKIFCYDNDLRSFLTRT